MGLLINICIIRANFVVAQYCVPRVWFQLHLKLVDPFSYLLMMKSTKYVYVCVCVCVHTNLNLKVEATFANIFDHYVNFVYMFDQILF